jgi:hypothetical protein
MFRAGVLGNTDTFRSRAPINIQNIADISLQSPPKTPLAEGNAYYILNFSMLALFDYYLYIYSDMK